MDINITDFTSQSKIREEYLRGLNNRCLDEKYFYIGETQAKEWLTICYDSEYQYYKNSLKIISEIASDIANYTNCDLNIIALGSGDGIKEKRLSEELSKTHQVALFPVELSNELLEICLKNIKDLTVPKEAFVADILSSDITKIGKYVRENYYHSNLFTLLGNTFGNYSQAAIMKVIREAMQPNDFILIGVNLIDCKSEQEEIEEIKKTTLSYSNPAYKAQILLPLADTNIEFSDGEVVTEYTRNRFFPQIRVIENYFQFNKSKVVRAFGEDIYFAKGERILVSYSNKYTLEVLENIIASYGLRIVKNFSPKTGYTKLLCQLTHP